MPPVSFNAVKSVGYIAASIQGFQRASLVASHSLATSFDVTAIIVDLKDRPVFIGVGQLEIVHQLERGRPFVFKATPNHFVNSGLLETRRLCLFPVILPHIHR